MFHRRALSAFLIPLTCFAVSAAAQEVRSSWQCLPDETVFAVRIPQGNAFMEAMRRDTQLGAVMLNPQRLEKAKAFFKEHNPDGWKKIEETLDRHKLSLDDWTRLIGTDFGYAALLEPREDREPLQIGLLWMEPGEELAERFYQAIADMVEHQDEKENPVTRVDIELAGCQVMHLTEPQIGFDFAELWGAPPDWENMDEEQIEAWFRQQAERRRNAKPQVVDYRHLMIARLGSRLLIAHTNPQSSAYVLEAKRQNQQLDIAGLTGVEPLTGVFARFLESHKNGGTEFAERIMSTHGVDTTLPGGTPGIELVFDIGRIITMTREQSPESLAVFERLGLANLGPMVARLSLDGSNLRATVLASIPAPRSGLPELFESLQRNVEPPAWVGADVVEYSHFVLPLDKIFLKIREVATATDAGAQMMFDSMEEQAQQIAQTDVASLLAGLGDQLGMLRFMPRIPPADEVEKIDEWDVAEPTERYAVIWQLQDEALWRRTIQGFSDMLGGALPPPGEEQGFTSWRSSDEDSPGGLFIGRGYMVVAIGENVAEETLAMLRNPPVGEAALRNSENFRRAAALVPPRQALAYGVTDTRRHLSAFGAMFKANFFDYIIYSGMFLNDEGEFVNGLTSAQLGQAMEELLPTAEESDGFFGISASQLYINEAGLVLEVVMEVPAPQ